MAGTHAQETLGWDAYLAWEARQEVRHELVDGVPRAMVGGTATHDLIGNALRAELRARLRASPGPGPGPAPRPGQCRVQGPDLKLRTGTANVRYPDALVDCGRFDPDAIAAVEPVAVFEVLSRSTAWIDQVRKLADYDATSSIQHYALVSQDEARVLLYNRADGRLDHRAAVLHEDRAAVLRLPALGIEFLLAEIYADLPSS